MGVFIRSEQGRWRSGFTLVEVMASLAIIAVLAGLVVAVTRLAIASAKSSACLSNLKQRGLAEQLYLESNDGLYSPYSFESYIDSKGGKVSADPQAYKTAMEAYGMVDDQFYCPLDRFARKKDSVYSEVVDHTETSYSTSLVPLVFGDLGVDWVSLRSGSIPYPSRSMFLYDTGVPSDHPVDYTPTPHGDRSNVLFYDTHSESRSTHAPECQYPSQEPACKE